MIDYNDKCKQIAEKWHYAYDNSTMTEQQVKEFLNDCDILEIQLDDVIEVLNAYEI